MDTLLSAAHLRRELGEELFKALVSSDNTGKVRTFAQSLVNAASDRLPTELTLGDRTYEILGFLKPGETSVKGDVMVQRAKEMNAHLGKEDGQWFLDHQDDIPESLRGKVAFVFTDWRYPDASRDVYYVFWHDASRRWFRHWHHLPSLWLDLDRLVRRK